MKSGLDFSNDDFTLEMAYDVRGDGAAHILRKPLVHQPGTFYNYQDCDPHLVGAALERLTGASLEEFAVANLFGKIGISDFIWLRHRDGTTYGAYGLYLTPRNLARLGKLVIQRGQWDGAQVVSPAWIDTSTAKQTDMDPEGASHGFDYGFYWWRVPELGAFTAYGHGGQYVLVVPAKNLVVVMTAEPDTNGDTAEILLPHFVDLARIVIEAAGP
jgi:CubicO group peptidase (beta-lactamase class C family)